MNHKVFYLTLSTLLAAIIILITAIIHQYHSGTIKDTNASRLGVSRLECPKQKETVNIVLITDSYYVVPTSVSISSAIKNKCPSSIYNFYIIAENITEKEKQSLLKLQQQAPQTVNIEIIPQSEPDLPYQNMQRFLWYKVAMHKIFLPQILQKLDKVIYMDGDTLVLKDLRDLYKIDVDDVYAAVAKDGIYYRFPQEMAEMGLDKRGYYFNSGVMLHNLKLQRQDNIVKKSIEYINSHQDFFGDQDVLNVVFGDKLKLMSYRYNCISTFFEQDDLTFLSHFYGEELPQNRTQIYQQAVIIHYAGDKPWHEKYKPLFLKNLWFRYYNATKDLQ